MCLILLTSDNSYSKRVWNDLLLRVFGELNEQKCKHKDKKGLENVAQTLKEFKNNNIEIPHTTDKEISNIKKVLFIRKLEIKGRTVFIYKIETTLDRNFNAHLEHLE